MRKWGSFDVGPSTNGARVVKGIVKIYSLYSMDDYDMAEDMTCQCPCITMQERWWLRYHV
jgi:hypothetical protein